MFRFLLLHSCFISIVGRVSVPAQSASKQQNKPPTWVPFLSQPDLFYNNFPRLVSNIGTGHVVPKDCPSRYYFFARVSEGDLNFQVIILNARSYL